jgi:hypothetical protein
VLLIFWWLPVVAVQTLDDTTEHGMGAVVLAV